MKKTSKLYLGSIDPMKIDKSKIKEFKRKDGTIGKSIDVTIWVDDEPDEDWKAVNILQSTKKDEPPIYIGNAKRHIPKDQQKEAPKAVPANATEEEDPLPF